MSASPDPLIVTVKVWPAASLAVPVEMKSRCAVFTSEVVCPTSCTCSRGVRPGAEVVFDGGLAVVLDEPVELEPQEAKTTLPTNMAPTLQWVSPLNICRL